MKNLVFATLIAAAASQAAGCIIFSDDDGSGDLGDIRVSWNLLSTNLNDPANGDVAAGCPVGADTVTLFAMPVGAPEEPAFQDKYDCIDGAGTLADLDPGQYTVWARITDHSGATVFAESFSQDVQVFSGNVTSAPTDIYVDRGFISVGWTLRGRATTCSGITNGGVSILATDGGGAARGFDTVVDCEEGEGRETITQPLPSVGSGAPGIIGRYNVALSLLNQAGGRISDTTNVPNATVDYGNALESIGIQQITIP